VLEISAFLFAALIFFVSFFYQEKKESKLLISNDSITNCHHFKTGKITEEAFTPSW
jgi:hypothetical protein